MKHTKRQEPDEEELYFYEKKKDKDTEKKDFSESWYYLSVFGQIGFAIAIPIAAGAIVGQVIDTRLGTSPRWTLILIGVGFFISILSFIKIILKFSKESK